MEKMEAKGKTSAKEAEASVEEAEEPMEGENEQSKASGIHKN